MNNIYKFLLLLSVSFGFVACEVDEIIGELPPVAELPALNAGSLDFSNYVSVGASFTAGFTDGALFIASQENSFPNILSQQFAKANGGDFTQPLMNDNIGGLLFGGTQIQEPRLFFDGVGPVRLTATPTTELTAGSPGPYNNMGVPGAKSFHLLYDGYGNPANLGVSANPYFIRMASGSSATVLGDAMMQSPSFFTVSLIGGNDVLGYATTGGDGSDAITPSAGPPGVGFDQTFGYIVSTLASGGAKGVITNIPYITDLPHFTTVPHAPLDPTSEAYGPLIPTLNTVYGALNDVYAYLEFVAGAIDDSAARTITFSQSAASAVVIKDENLPDLSAQIAGVLGASPQFAGLLASFGLSTDPVTVGAVAALFGATYGQSRQATADDLLVLPSSSVIGTVNTDVMAFLMSRGLSQAVAGQFSVEGITLPLADKWVLLPSEQIEVKTAIDNYNTTIATVASSNPNIALVDLNSILAIASTAGVNFDDFTLTTNLVVGGLISLDGIHLTSKGYALMANEFLKAMDGAFDSNFVEAGATAKAVDYGTNYSPLLQ